MKYWRWVGGCHYLLEGVSASQGDWEVVPQCPQCCVHWPAWTHSPPHSARCTAPCSEHARGMRPTGSLLAARTEASQEYSLRGACSSGPCSKLAALKDQTPAGVHRPTVPAPLFPTELDSEDLRVSWAGCQCRELTGRLIVSSRKRSAVPRAGLQAGGPAYLGHGGWRQEVGAQNTTFPGSGPGPRASFGREGRALATPSLAGPWLSPSSVWLSPCSPPSSLRQSAHSWQRHPFNLLPRKPDGQAGLLSQPRDGKQGGGPPSGFSCPYSLGAGLGDSSASPWLSWVRNNLSSISSLEQSG